MSAIKEKVAERATQKKVGYVAIYSTGDYGGRILDRGNAYLYENKHECEDNCSGDDNFVTVAEVTWED